MSEYWRFYVVPTARVIITAKTSFDAFSLSREQVWTFSVLDDQIYGMRCLFVAVGLSMSVIGPHANPLSHILLTLGRPAMFPMQAGTTPIFKVFGMTGPSTNRESNPSWSVPGPPIFAFYDQQGLLRTYSIPDLFTLGGLFHLS